MTLKLHTIICSTRPGRIGPSIATWFDRLASDQGSFDNELVDLADFHLPVFDEPQHPSKQQYEHEHTRAWSRSVEAADAYVFVLPEYNSSPPPSFVNALDFVYKEWNYKPCGFVSYGGVSGGQRSAHQAKLQVTTLKMMPMAESVTVQFPWKLLDDERRFLATEHHESSGKALLEELARWAQALRAMR